MYSNIRTISDKVLDEFPLHIDNTYLRYIVEEKILTNPLTITCTLDNKENDLSEIKTSPPNYSFDKRPVEYMIEYIMSHLSQLTPTTIDEKKVLNITLTGDIIDNKIIYYVHETSVDHDTSVENKNDSFIINNIIIGYTDKSTFILNTNDRDELLKSFYFKFVPVLYCGNLNNCITFAKKNENACSTVCTLNNTLTTSRSSTPDNYAEGLIIRPVIHVNNLIVKINNLSFIDKMNSKTKTEDTNNKVNYLLRIAHGYFNSNRLSVLANKNGKLVPSTRDKFIDLLCRDVTTTLKDDNNFVSKYRDLPEHLQNDINKKYPELATQLVDSFLNSLQKRK